MNILLFDKDTLEEKLSKQVEEDTGILGCKVDLQNIREYEYNTDKYNYERNASSISSNQVQLDFYGKNDSIDEQILFYQTTEDGIDAINGIKPLLEKILKCNFGQSEITLEEQFLKEKLSIKERLIGSIKSNNSYLENNKEKVTTKIAIRVDGEYLSSEKYELLKMDREFFSKPKIETTKNCSLQHKISSLKNSNKNQSQKAEKNINKPIDMVK